MRTLSSTSISLRRRWLLLVGALLTSTFSCVGGDSVGTGSPVAIGLLPSFQVEPSDFAAGPVDRIRTRALAAATRLPLGSTDEVVDPNAPQWVLSLGIDLGGQTSAEILVEVELLSGGVVVWSGRLGPISVALGRSATLREVTVYRGPLDNLDVQSVAISGAPTQLLVGSSGQATADVVLPAGSTASPEVFWVSLDPTIATVVVVDGVATITGVLPGTAQIAAAAGPRSSVVTVDVLPRIQSVVVTPASITVGGTGTEVAFSAEVIDGLGNPTQGEPVTWASSDPGVAIVGPAGLAVTSGFGTAQIRATAGGVTGSGTLTVAGPDLRVSDIVVTPDAQGTIVDLASVGLDATILNNGPAPAPATTLGIRVLDATGSQEVHPTLEYAIPAIDPAASYSFSDVVAGQAIPVTLPGQIRFEFVADFLLGVEEENEANNILQSGAFDVGALPGAATWVGTVDTDWTNSANWLGGVRPTSSSDDVVIQGGDLFPVISAITTVNNLTFDPYTTLTLRDGVTLVVGGNLLVGSLASIVSEGPGMGTIGMVGVDVAVSGSLQTNVQIAGTVGLSEPVSVSGDVTVTGSLSVPTGLALTIDGTFTLESGSSLDVEGVVTADGGCVDNGGLIIGLGTHPCGTPFQVVWVGGDASGATAWSNPNNWTPTGVPTASDVVTVPSTANPPVLQADAAVASLLMEPGAALDLGGFTLDVNADLDAGAAISNGLVVISGAGSLLQGDVPNLRIDASRTPSGPLTASGDVIINATLGMGGFGVTVVGNLTTATAFGRLDMRVSDQVEVLGDMVFDGATESGWLTEGSLLVGGDFTASATYGTSSFAGSGNHEVVLQGPAAQTVTLSNPGSGLQRFRHLALQNEGGDAVFGSDVVVTGDFSIGTSVFVDASDDALSVGGSFVDLSAGMLLRELIVIGDLTAVSTGVTADVTVNALFNLPGDFAVVGNLVTNNGLGIGANTLTVTGNLTTTTAFGRLDMRVAGGVVDVDGNVLFDGATENGWLTAGLLFVAGNFTATGTNSTSSFVGSGSHSVAFNGTAAQTVSFSNPATNLQRFQDVNFFNSAAGVTLLSDVVATGAFDVNTAATLDASDDVIYVGGSLNISAQTTLQDVIATGDWVSVSNTIPANVTVNANMSVPNSFTVAGDLVTNATLAIGSFTLTVTGDLTTATAFGRLDMRVAGGAVDVAGNALFDGTTENGWLTAGQLSVAGNFTATGTNSTSSFVGSGNHSVVLDGATSQSVTFSNPGTALQRFNNAAMNNTGGGIVFGSDVVVSGNFSVPANGFVDASDDALSVGGSYIDGSDGILLQDLIIIGDLTATSGGVAANVTVNSVFNMPSDFSVFGNVTVNQPLGIGGTTLSVTGNLSTLTAFGRLDMRTAGGQVTVDGDVLFNGATEAGWLTNGLITVTGNFTAGNTASTSSFAAAAAHEVRFTGSGLQTITFSNPGAALQRFGILSVFNVAGSITFASDAVVLDQLYLDTGVSVDASNDALSIGGSFVNAGGTIQLQDLIVIGNLTQIPATVAANVTVNADFTLPSDLFIDGDLTTNRTLTIGSDSLTVSGTVTTATAFGRLSMLVAGGRMVVDGDMFFDGATESGWLTQGTIWTTGNLQAASTNSPTSFVGTTNHTVVFNGNGEQIVSFTNPGTTGQRFQNVTITNDGTGVTFGSDVVATGNFILPVDVFLDASDDALSVGGSFVDDGASLSLRELIIIGNLTAIATTVDADVTVASTFDLPQDLNVGGNLTVNAPLGVGPFRLVIGGNFAVAGALARLDMRSPTSFVRVTGDASFDGGTQSGWLTAGNLELLGSFTVSSTFSPTSFVGSGTHTVVFEDGNQIVSFSNPGVTGQRMQNLTNQNFSGVASFATSAFVMGTFFADDVTMTRTGPVGTALELRGIAFVNATPIVGLPIRLVSTSAGPLHTIASVEFANMDPTDVQLYLELPGAGANSPLNMSNMVFDTPIFTSGAHLQTVRASGTDDMWVGLFSTFPAVGSATILAGLNTIVDWF